MTPLFLLCKGDLPKIVCDHILYHLTDKSVMDISRGLEEMETLLGQVLFCLALDECTFPEFDMSICKERRVHIIINISIFILQPSVGIKATGAGEILQVLVFIGAIPPNRLDTNIKRANSKCQSSDDLYPFFA